VYKQLDRPVQWNLSFLSTSHLVARLLLFFFFRSTDSISFPATLDYPQLVEGEGKTADKELKYLIIENRKTQKLIMANTTVSQSAIADWPALDNVLKQAETPVISQKLSHGLRG
jgi:hypothetical protein